MEKVIQIYKQLHLFYVCHSSRSRNSRSIDLIHNYIRILVKSYQNEGNSTYTSWPMWKSDWRQGKDMKQLIPFLP